MPLTIDPVRYGFPNIDSLGRALGTMQGEAGNQNLFGRAMVLDTAANRGQDSYFNTWGNYGGYTGATGQLANPSQYSTWNPREAGAYQAATQMHNIITRIGADPNYYDTLSPSMQQQVQLNLAAADGILGNATLRGIAGNSTFYSTGNRASFSDRTWGEHQRMGLGQSMEYGPRIDGEYWYDRNPAVARSIYDNIQNFDRTSALNNLIANYDPALQTLLRNNVNPPRVITDPPQPPDRPTDAELGIDNRGPLDRFSDTLTEGLQGAARGIAGQYQAVLGRLPSVQELQSQIQGVASGATGLFDVFNDIATSPEAQARAQQTGVDPSLYVPNRADFSMLDVSQGNGPTGLGTFSGGLNPSFPTGGTSFANGGRPSGFVNPTGAFSGFGINPASYGMQPGRGLPNLGMGTAQTLGPGATQLPVGFDPAAYLLANPDVRDAGADPAQHYRDYGMQEGRALAPAGWTPTQGPTGLSPTLGFDGSTSSTYSPTGLSPTLGAGTASPTLGFTGATASPNKGGPSLSPTFGAPGLSPLLGTGQTVGTQGAGLLGGTLGFNGTTAGPMIQPDLAPTLQTGTTVGTRGPDTTVQAWEPGGALNPNTALPSQTVETQGPGASVGTFGPGPTVGTQGPGLLGTVAGFNGTLAPTLGPSTFDDGKGGVPGLSPLLGPGTLAPTLGPGPTVTAQEPTGLGAGFNPSGVGTAGGTMGLSPTGSASGTGGNFTGTGTAGGSAYFDPAAYLAANPDLARAGVDPFQHYEQYGYREGRPIDSQGHTLSQNFDPVAYFTRNPDVAAAGANAFDHYLHNGGREGREFTTGSSPYTFTGANAGGGLGAQATGFQGLNPLAGATQPSAQVGPYDFGTRNVSGGVGNGAFGLGGIGGNGGLGIGNPFGFSGANVGGGLGAMSQSFGSLYPVGGYSGSPAGGGIGSPYGFSGADVSGFSANTGGQEDFGSGEGLGPVTYESSGGFDPVSSQRAYFAHQENMNNQAIAAGRTPVQNATAITPNPWAVQLANSAPRLQPITPYVMNSGGAMVVNAPAGQLSTSWAPLGTPGWGGM